MVEVKSARNNLMSHYWATLCSLMLIMAISGCSFNPFKGPLFKTGKESSIKTKSSNKTELPNEFADTTWLISFEDALADSSRTNRPIIVNFTGSDWCTWCHKLEDEVFDHPDFKQWANENAVLLELDFPRRGSQSETTKQQNRQLANRFSVDAYPTVLILDSSGNELGRTGYIQGGPDKFIEAIARMIN